MKWAPLHNFTGISQRQTMGRLRESLDVSQVQRDDHRCIKIDWLAVDSLSDPTAMHLLFPTQPEVSSRRISGGLSITTTKMMYDVRRGVVLPFPAEESIGDRSRRQILLSLHYYFYTPFGRSSVSRRRTDICLLSSSPPHADTKQPRMSSTRRRLQDFMHGRDVKI